MPLVELFAPGAVSLDLRADTPDTVLAELVALLGVDARTAEGLTRALHRREMLGSTGVGRGIAIPHCRSPLVPTLRLAYGRHVGGIDYGAIDGLPVRHFFLIAATPPGAGDQYLPVLGRIAQFAKESEVLERLDALRAPDEFLALLRERGA
jgi:mannitol/fructose-specific phosphotransferase system IIA component (Ntr-type)